MATRGDQGGQRLLRLRLPCCSGLRHAPTPVRSVQVYTSGAMWWRMRHKPSTAPCNDCSMHAASQETGDGVGNMTGENSRIGIRSSTPQVYLHEFR